MLSYSYILYHVNSIGTWIQMIGRLGRRASELDKIDLFSSIANVLVVCRRHSTRPSVCVLYEQRERETATPLPKQLPPPVRYFSHQLMDVRLAEFNIPPSLALSLYINRFFPKIARWEASRIFKCTKLLSSPFCTGFCTTRRKSKANSQARHSLAL